MTIDHSPALRRFRWQAAFPPQVLERGLNYAARGHVIEVESLDPEGLHLLGAVQGSEPEPYECEVRLLQREGSHVLVSSCTCPMAAACKHVVAVLAAADGVGSPAPGLRLAPEGEDWPAWLQAWQQPDPPLRALSAEPGQLALMLRATTWGNPAKLLAAMVSLREGKRGGLVDPRNLHEGGHEPQPAPAGGWPEPDLLALSLLLQRQHERVGSLHLTAIHTHALESALLHLLQRYPAFWERASKPLTPGESRRLAFAWRDEADGSQRLAPGVEGAPEAQLLIGDGLWYVDLAAGRIGRVSDSPRRLAQIARAPRVAPEASGKLRERLGKALGEAGLPLPAERRPPRRIEAKPRLVLRLEGQPSLPPRRGRGKPEPVRVGVASVAFEYQGFRVEHQGPPMQRLLQDGEAVEVVRDRAAELALQQKLSRRYLLPAVELPWSFSYRFDHLDDSHRLLLPKGERWPLPPERWTPLLRELMAEGALLEFGKDFPRPLREIAVSELQAEVSESGPAWFDLALGVDIEGERIDLLPVLRQVLADPAFPLHKPKGERKDASWRVALDQERALRLPLDKLRALVAPLLELLGSEREGSLRLHRTQAATVAALDASGLRWRGDEALRQRMGELLRRPDTAKPPRGLVATLRPYQLQGLAWLNFLAEAGLGGVLADDMGLGKTVQVLAHLLAEKKRLGKAFRCLVVAPTSLMGNWQDEAARFAPSLKVLLLHGADRADRFDAIARHDVVLTTYPLLPRDRERLIEQRFSLLVLDEAQAVKNARSQAAQVVRELQAERRLAMTGTPLENHLGELWAQFDAVEPGLLGSEREFNRLYRTPIEKQGDGERQARLNRRIAPLLLRRRKDEVLAELPPKTESVRHLELEGAQRALYESLRLAQHERVREAIAARGLAQSGIVVLDALLKLRQVCCDPRLVKLPQAAEVGESSKLEAALELLDGLLDEGRRVLLFSQFASMLDLLGEALSARGQDFLRLTGDTPGGERADLVRRFQAGEVPLFLISLKAGGTGLNLTAADTVIHYDPWWNPAVEAQATDRAHRIGQERPVFVYKLICRGTVEEKIQALQTRKAALAQAVLEGGSSQRLAFDETDLAELFAPLG
jgi:superfamily II DNA or RNA helicase